MKRIFCVLLLGAAFFCAFGPSYVSADCPDKTYLCVKDHGKGKSTGGDIKSGQCWRTLAFPPGCYECEDNAAHHARLAKECNEQNASECKGKCYACTPGRKSEVLCYDEDGHVHAFD